MMLLIGVGPLPAWWRSRHHKRYLGQGVCNLERWCERYWVEVNEFESDWERSLRRYNITFIRLTWWNSFKLWKMEIYSTETLGSRVIINRWEAATRMWLKVKDPKKIEPQIETWDLSIMSYLSTLQPPPLWWILTQESAFWKIRTAHTGKDDDEQQVCVWVGLVFERRVWRNVLVNRKSERIKIK